MLCVGGAREALLAEQEEFQIVLGRRLVGCRPSMMSLMSLKAYNLNMLFS